MEKLTLMLSLALLVGACSSTTTPKVQPNTLPKIVLDSDKDGVNDNIDLCPATPSLVVVDNNGCPSDGMDRTHLMMEGRISYRPNQAAISSEQLEMPFNGLKTSGRDVIKSIAAKWHEHTDAVISIEGHASRHEGKSENDRMQLSKLRASTVKYALIRDFGLSRAKIIAKGCGANRPIADENDKSQWFFNSRVYILSTNAPSRLEDWLDELGNFKSIDKDCEIAD